MFFRNSKHKIIIACLLLIIAFFFSCKGNQADSIYLSASGSSAVSNSFSSATLLDETDFSGHNLKSAIGPAEAVEYPIDDDFFKSYPEVFSTSFSPYYFTSTHSVKSDSNISLNFSSPSDIWYVFTNTSGKDLKLPDFSVPVNGFSVQDVNVAPELPTFPKIPNMYYKRGPGKIDANKSCFPSLDSSGPAQIYFSAKEPDITETFITPPISNKRLKDGILSALSRTGFEGCEIHFADQDKLAKQITTSIVLSVLCPVLVPIITLVNYSDRVKGRTPETWFDYLNMIETLFGDGGESYLVLTFNYAQCLTWFFGRAIDASGRSQSLPNDTYKKVINKNGKEVRVLVNLADYYSYFPSEFGNLANNFDFVLLFYNSVEYPALEYEASKFWLPVQDENRIYQNENSEKRIYNYANLNYYNYYNPSDPNGVYISDGSLGFGIYIPSYGLYYPLDVSDGPDGRGYYVANKLIRFEDTDYTSTITEDNDADDEGRVISFDFNDAVIPSSLDVNSFVGMTEKRINNKELPTPYRVVKNDLTTSIKKVDDSDGDRNNFKGSDEGQNKNINIVKSPLGDYVGSKQIFVEPLSSLNGDYYREAECKFVREVDTVLGKRYLVIYQDNNLVLHPSDEEYERIADAFLKSGSNNDIYDKITNVFGSEWGYFNSTYLKSFPENRDKEIPFIPKTNTLTFFYTDIGDVGESSSYLPAYYFSSDMYLNSASPSSNERLMIHVHAPKAGGNYFEENIIAIACEFERLIHDQYFSKKLVDFLPYSPSQDNTKFSDYFFSFLAKVIASNAIKNDTTSNTLTSSYNLYPFDNTSFTDLFGMDKYYLFGADKFNMLDMTLTLPTGVLADCNTIAKSVISTLAYYIYTNFGSGFIQTYTLGNKEGLEGIIDAINETYNISLTLSDILFSLRYATLLSYQEALVRPNTFNYANRFKVRGVNYPNINFYNTKAYLANSNGIPVSTSLITNNSSSSYRVANGFSGEYKAKAPVLPKGLRLDVVATTPLTNK